MRPGAGSRLPATRRVPRAVLGLLLVCAGASRAGDEMDEILEGFGAEEVEFDAAPLQEEASWEISGGLSLGGSFNYAQHSPAPGRADYRGVSRLRLDLDLRLDVELPWGLEARMTGRGLRDFAYSLRNRDEYTHDVLELYEAEVETRELFIEGSPLDAIDIRFGRQIVNWGRSDSLRVLDVLNPLDNREPGLVDIEDLRLPVTMTRIDWFSGPWRITGIAVHESRFGRDPAYGSDFYPVGFRPPAEDMPANGGRDTEWAARIGGVFQGWDFSLHWARYFDDEAHLGLAPGLGVDLRVLSQIVRFQSDHPGQPLPPGLSIPPSVLVLLQPLLSPQSQAALPPELVRARHSRVTLFGASANLALGNVLLKTEIARLDGLGFLYLGREERARTDVMLGIEYSGVDHGVVALEVVNRHLHAFDSKLEPLPDFGRRNALEAALRYSADFANSTVHVTALGLVFSADGEHGGAIRVSVDHDVRDAIRVGVGVLVFLSDAHPLFDRIEDNDRIFFSASYRF